MKIHIDDAIDQISEWTSSQIARESISESLNSFQDSFGKTFPEDEFYDQRLHYFLEYFVLCTQLRDPLRITPFSLFHATDHQLAGTLKRSGASSILERARHGLFRIIKVRKDETVVEDCFHGHRFLIRSKDGESVGFLRKQEIVQGFVFPLESVGTKETPAYIGRGLVLHPKKSWKAMKKRLRDQRKAGVFQEIEFLKWAAQRQVLCHRYRKVDPLLIYGEKIYPST